MVTRPFLSSRGTDVVEVQVVLAILPAKLEGSEPAHLDGGTWIENRGQSSTGFSKSLQGNYDYFLDYIRQYLLSFGAEFLSSSLLTYLLHGAESFLRS